MTGHEIPNGTVTSPQGFFASGLRAGIKKSKRKLDCSLLVSEVPAVSAGMFTKNKVKAWPLLYDEAIVRHPTHRAILANSGNANCFNGPSGKRAVETSLRVLAKTLEVPSRSILLASTGIIGKAFPIEKLTAAIPALVSQLSKEGGTDAARGILTTDTHPKEMAVRFQIGGKDVTVAGMAKGSGMVYPAMELPRARHATMLCFLTSDIAISKPMLREALAEVVDSTFNHISVDNDMSTNDTVLILANGLAGNRPIISRGPAFNIFKDALAHVCAQFARALVKDGEGVRHVCEIRIEGAKTKEEARRAADKIATSMLFKTMLAGEDPNWGRVAAAVGGSGVEFSNRMDVAFDDVLMLKNGKPIARNRSRARKVLQKSEFVLKVNLKKGRSKAMFLTTDLTKFYVWINASYSS